MARSWLTRGRFKRANTYDPATKAVTVAPIRAEAFQANLQHYSDVFANGKAEYAIPAGAVTDPIRLRQLSAFYFWNAWAASTNRPDDNITYTNNWPYEPLVGNRPTGDTVVWTGVSIIMLLAGISAMVWWYAARKSEEEHSPLPEADPLGSWVATPSQKATVKYFWVVSALILLQMLLGVVTAHYGVEGDGFYGIPLSDWLPYSVTRTWHILRRTRLLVRPQRRVHANARDAEPPLDACAWRHDLLPRSRRSCFVRGGFEDGPLLSDGQIARRQSVTIRVTPPLFHQHEQHDHGRLCLDRVL